MTKLPVILVGDFNAAAGANPAYDTLLEEGKFVRHLDDGRKTGTRDRHLPQLRRAERQRGPHRLDPHAWAGPCVGK